VQWGELLAPLTASLFFNPTKRSQWSRDEGSSGHEFVHRRKRVAYAIGVGSHYVGSWFGVDASPRHRLLTSAEDECEGYDDLNLAIAKYKTKKVTG
jgi:hypothetical protein